MPLEKPDSLRIYVPTSLGMFNLLAEPELEGQGGTDVLGNAIADGEQAINIMDGFPDQQITVDTAGERSTWRIDTAFSKLKSIGFAMLDMHNLLGTYSLAIRQMVSQWFHTADSFGSAIEAVPNTIFSGLLGKDRPFTRYNGVDAYLSVANDANLNFGANSDFSLHWRGKIAAIPASTHVLIFKKESTSTGHAGYGLAVNSSGKAITYISDGGTSKNTVSTIVVADNEEHDIVATFDRDGVCTIYIDGVVNGTPVGISTVGDCDNTRSLFFCGTADFGRYLECDNLEDLLYNRVLAPKEVEQMALGCPVPNPLIIDDNSSMNTVGGYTTNANCSIEVDSGMQKITASGADGQSYLTADTIAGHRYILEFDYKNTASDFAKYFVYDLDNAAFIIGKTTLADSTSLTSVNDITFTAGSGSTRIGIGTVNNGDIVYFDNAYLTDLDTLVTFPLLVDQWGDSSAIPNGVAPFAWSDIGPGYNTAVGATVDDWTNRGTHDADNHISGSLTGPLRLVSDGTFTGLITSDAVFIAGESCTLRVVITDEISGSINIVEAESDGSNPVTLATISTVGTHDIRFTSTSGLGYLQISRASGATDISYNIVLIVGAVAAYQHDGISKDQGKWLDGSGNGLNGVFTNIEVVDGPEVGNDGFYLTEFNEVRKSYAFMQVAQDDGATNALLDTLLGSLIYGPPAITLPIKAEGGYKVKPGYLNIVNISETGRRMSENVAERVNEYTIDLASLSQSQSDSFDEVFDIIKGNLLPFYICFNFIIAGPIFRRVVLISHEVSEDKGGVKSWQRLLVMRDDL